MNLVGTLSRASFHWCRRGLTLIELVVVLAILMALAGIVLGSIPALLRQTSAATAGAGAAEVNAAMLYYRTHKGGFPDGYDSLLEAPYTLLKTLPKGSLHQLKPKDLDNADRPFLAAVGIRTTWQHDPTNDASGVTFRPLTWLKTFDSTLGGVASDDVAALDTTRIDVDDLFGPGTKKGGINEIFAVFGLGPKCTLVGADGGILAAPVTFNASPGTNPMDVYQRYGLVFRLDRDEGRPARFLGTVIFDSDGIKTSGQKAQEWFVR